ncbi:lys-63-specific deubiquitinase BRCC36-like [Tigriopus californicus]|uniref:lys-63-specific deubiquitinase BRCC36-like n=1 Tax=Tigriopus californicus TaxID=6832 RepID=UPI0027DA22AD|nr:lys-63-specific deubiquitinase BRCC36-like [Tigriopus californicus]XP_059086958.1 lys-63-specific deubiquitinase BRCC36-like [Tigriopus californicus]|eukprot:TCALIF_12871-PA protein Name:"Similar to brcc3 Lys-63-specific deubiquitinase BRCC36 (Salmo salar)" AED:0.73 eAED:0.73 QI:0/0/0/0.33/1/0.66/3/0/292
MIEAVILSAQVQEAIVRHAMVTEKEEIMGFLLGQVDEGGSRLVITGLDATVRSDRKSDRVEVSPEQAVASSEKAEQIGLRVLGWYHSHPHITVWPSHVDLRTQFSMQQMDRDFVGIICSVFCRLDLNDASQSHPKKRRALNPKGERRAMLAQQVKMTCFQASRADDGSLVKRDIQIVVQSHQPTLTDDMAVQCQAILYAELVQERQARLEKLNRHPSGVITEKRPELIMSRDQIKLEFALAHHQLVQDYSIPMAQALIQDTANIELEIRTLTREKNRLRAQLRGEQVRMDTA